MLNYALESIRHNVTVINQVYFNFVELQKKHDDFIEYLYVFTWLVISEQEWLTLGHFILYTET